MVANNFITVLLGAVFIECLIRLDILGNLKKLSIVVKKTLWVIHSPRISDHWKEKILLSYSIQLFISSISLFILLIVASFPIVITTFVLYGVDYPLFEYVTSAVGIVIATISATMYMLLRTYFGK